MPYRAWAYIWGIFLTGAILTGLALQSPALLTSQWKAFTALVVLATIAQLFKAQAPNHQLYHATLVFLFAGVILEERLKSPYEAGFIPRPRIEKPNGEGHSNSLDALREGKPAARPHTNTTDRPKTQEKAVGPAVSVAPDGKTAVAPIGSSPAAHPRAESRNQLDMRLRLFVGGIITLGATVTALGFVLVPHPDWIVIGLLAVLAVLAELLQLNLYGEDTVSVSVSIAFAAALIADIPGVACTSAGIALAHNVRRRPALYQSLFNWAAHTLAGLPAAITTTLLGMPLHAVNIPFWVVLGGTIIAYYVVDTGLIAIAMGLAENINPTIKWRDQFEWLAYHYAVLCLIGLFLGIAYTELGPPSVVVFTLPVLMVRHAQRQYIERTAHSVRELRRMNWELSQANHEVVTASQAMRQLNNELFLTLAKIIGARDPYVAGHATQVAHYATAVATKLDLPANRIEYVRQAAFFRDIGKIGISEKILHKPAKLTRKEYKYVKTHVTIGTDFLATSQGLRHLASFIKHHHEHWNGQGYPDGLHGAQIPLEARILAVCDAVEAMASDRPYHTAMPMDEILEELQRCAGTQFDPTVVETFIRVAEEAEEPLIVNSARTVVQNGAFGWDPADYDSAWPAQPATQPDFQMAGLS